MGRFKPDCHASDSLMNAVIVGEARMFQTAKRVLILSQRSKLCRALWENLSSLFSESDKSAPPPSSSSVRAGGTR